MSSLLDHDAVGAGRLGGGRLVGMAGKDRHRAAREQRLPPRPRALASPMMARADDEDGVAVAGRVPSSRPCTAIETGSCRLTALVGDRVRDTVQHRGVGDDLLGPAAAQVGGEADRPPRREDAAVELEAARRPAAGAVGTGWIDPADQAGEDRVHRHPGADRNGAVGAGLDHRPGDLVAEHERQGAERHQGRRPSTGRREQVQIAAADPSAGHRHPRPLPGRQLRFGHLGEGGRKPGVGQIESDGLHAGSLPQPRSPGASCPCGALRRGIDTIERPGGLTPIYLVI